MNFESPHDWDDLRATVRAFCENEVTPRWREIEETDTVPPELLRQAGDLGLFGLTIPAEYGGLELPMLARALIYEELGRTHAGFTSIIGTHCGIGTTALVLLGNEDQKRRYLPTLASGEGIGAFALTEPGAGSDAASLQLSAVEGGTSWVLSGTKHFITNSQLASVFTVFARTDRTAGSKGISAFVVDAGTKGLSISRSQPTMGLRGSHAAELIFDDCRVPKDALLGKAGDGYSAALRTLGQGRVGIAARCVGAADRVTEMAVEYSRERHQFGQPISDFQMIRAYLAEMATETSAARALTHYAAWLIDQGRPAKREAAMAKLISTESYGRTVDKALQIHGGMGYCADVEVEHFYRDARITRIYEGTSEIQKLVIARDMLRAG